MKRLYKDCFAYDEKNQECVCLRELVCRKTDLCSFYKHKSEVNWREIEKAIKNYSNPANKVKEGDTKYG